MLVLGMLQQALLHVLQVVSQQHSGQAPLETPEWVASLT